MRGATTIALVLCLWAASCTFGKERNSKAEKSLNNWYYTTFPTPTCDKDYSCEDCTTVRVCAPNDTETGYVQIAKFRCPSYKPWCDASSGTCTSVQPGECVNKNPVPGQFTCMRDGLYPNINNCSSYFQCEGDSPYLINCTSDNPYYSPYDQQCQDDPTRCANYDYPCYGITGRKVLIGYTLNMFAYCEEGWVLTVDRCIGAYKLNLTSQNCEPSCPQAGLFPSADDCAQYYRCNPRSRGPGNTDYTMTTNLTCPEGMGFLEEAYDCVNRTLVPNCRVQPQFFS